MMSRSREIWTERIAADLFKWSSVYILSIYSAMWRLVSARVCVQDTGGCVPMPREAPGPSEHHLEGFSGGAGDDSVCCWAPGQGALASVALDFHARHWVPLFCYRSALKYPAFGHSFLKITSVGAVLFYLFIRELCGAAVKCSSSQLVAGWLLASCLRSPHCTFQSLTDTAQNRGKMHFGR